MQSIAPKEGDVFRGELRFDGKRLSTLSGARLLTSFQREGPYWVASGQNQHGQVIGQCMADAPRCGNPEDFFFDDKPLKAVDRLGALNPGTFFFDYNNQKIYFVDDPDGHKVEIGTTRSAFNGTAPNVTIQDLIIEKYAAPDQVGAIGDWNPGTGWTIRNDEVRWNHGTGILATTGFKILDNYVHDNGQLGIGGTGDDILVEGNEIAYNRDYTGTDCGWECGGLKFAETNRLTVRGNNSHHNLGPGLWTDGDCINTLYENNSVIENEQGIVHEISYQATIRNNIVRRNGSSAADSWYWYAQIQISTSRDVEIYGNTVEVDSSNNGNGIVLIQQDRSADSGSHGPYQTVNNYVHDNTIIVSGTRYHGFTGAALDYGDPNLFASSNKFDSNRYFVRDTNLAGFWVWQNQTRNWLSFRSLGQEAHGTALISSVSVSAVLNAADMSGQAVAPGSLVAIFGSELASGTSTTNSTPLPTSLGDVRSVTWNGVAAPIAFVSPRQINVQVPWEVAPGVVTLVVNRESGSSPPQQVNVSATWPSLLTVSAAGQAMAINIADGSIAAPEGSVPGMPAHPAAAGDVLLVYATGLGATDPPGITGAASLDQLRTTLSIPAARIGGIPAPLLFSGLSPQFAGVNQINFQVPQDAPSGDSVPLQIQSEGRWTNDQVTIAIR